MDRSPVGVVGDDEFGVQQEVTMRRSVAWLSNQIQQGSMVKVAQMPTFARTGPSVKGGVSQSKKKEKNEPFVVGQSVVGGEEVIK